MDAHDEGLGMPEPKRVSTVRRRNCGCHLFHVNMRTTFVHRVWLTELNSRHINLRSESPQHVSYFDLTIAHFLRPHTFNHAQGFTVPCQILLSSSHVYTDVMCFRVVDVIIPDPTNAS